MDENNKQEPLSSNSFANQAIPNSQPLNTPSVTQTVTTPSVQPSPTSYQQQPSFAVTSNATSNITTEEKESKVKYLVYFLLGLILSVLGLLIGIILIMVKEKQAKMRKLIFLLIGVTLSIVVWFVIAGGIRFEGTTTTSTINTSQPRSLEEKELVSDLTKLYPSLIFQVAYGEHKPPLTIGNTTISTFVKVEISSDNNISPEIISETGKQVCATLNKLQKSASQVEVATVSKKSVISQSLSGIGGTCEEYNSGEILTTLQKMQK
ncbi:hypothetical protein HY439_03650 [Candidatus Microgenomates bacterium]|nr:hypothetical protein [Candidatus Microgenomates bacterium]